MANINENTTNVYYALDEQMMAYRDEGDTHSQAEEIAHVLIKHAGLPLLIRCRALCVLGCSEEGDYVHYAEQSVHFAKLGLFATQEEGGDNTDGKSVLKGCEKGLAAAKAAAAAKAIITPAASTESAKVEVEQYDRELVDDEQVLKDEGDEDVDDEGSEVVWHADWDEERKAAANAKQDALYYQSLAAGEGDVTAAT
jgi:hypothetical protein